MNDGWRPIECAPKDETIVDVWHWQNGRWRPALTGLGLPVFVQPTDWIPLPGDPR